MADPIAVIGAVTGGSALAIQIGVFVRDRPQLAIGHQATANDDGAYLVIELANNGRQPTTLIKAGYVIDMDFEISNETKADLPAVPGKFEIRLDQGLHRLVPPGTTTRYVLPLDEWPGPMVHADFPLRPFAIDSRKRRIWGGAAPLIRLLLNKGWRPPSGTPLELLKPHRGLVEVTPVEPGWKLWKPKGLRKPRTYEPTISPRWLEAWEKGEPPAVPPPTSDTD